MLSSCNSSLCISFIIIIILYLCSANTHPCCWLAGFSKQWFFLQAPWCEAFESQAVAWVLRLPGHENMPGIYRPLLSLGQHAKLSHCGQDQRRPRQKCRSTARPSSSSSSSSRCPTFWQLRLPPPRRPPGFTTEHFATWKHRGKMHISLWQGYTDVDWY